MMDEEYNENKTTDIKKQNSLNNESETIIEIDLVMKTETSYISEFIDQ